MATLTNLKPLMSNFVQCDDSEERLAMASELTQAISATIDKVSREPNLEERKILIDHFDVEVGPAFSESMRMAAQNDENKGVKGSTVFYPFVVPPEMKAIDPRDTIARRFCGNRANNFFFTIYFRHALSAGIILTMAVTGGICLLLGLTGIVVPEVSWGSFLLVPFLLCFFAMLNRHLLHVLRKEFDFWVLFILCSVSCGSFVDMVWEDPQRIVAVAFLYGCSLALVTSDARPAFRKKAYGYRLIFVGATLVYAFILALYHANVWVNYRNTIYHIGIGNGIDFQVPSIGMGCAWTLCILTGKYAWVILRSTDGNPVVVIRASIVLRPFAKGIRPHPKQAPHAVLRRNSVPVVDESQLRLALAAEDTGSGAAKDV